MTSAQVVETSVNVISNRPSQDYTHPDDRTLLYDMTPGFKPFTIIIIIVNCTKLTIDALVADNKEFPVIANKGCTQSTLSKKTVTLFVHNY